MTPAVFIRKRVLQMTQDALAAAVGVTQPTVSRWERDGRIPADAQPKVRDLARARGAAWSDSYFFEVPPSRGEAAA